MIEIPNWYAPAAILLALLLQAFVIAGHWRLAKQFGWITPLFLSAVVMTTVMLPRIVTMLFAEGFGDNLDVINNVNSTIYLFNSSLFLASMWTFTDMIYKGRDKILDRIRDDNQLRRLKNDLKQLSVGFVDYWQMAESLPEGIIMIDDEGTILYVNDSLCDMTGFTKTQLIAQPLFTLMPNRYREEHLKNFRDFLQTGQSHCSWQGRMVHCLTANKQEIPVEISYSAFMADGNRRFVGIVRRR